MNEEQLNKWNEQIKHFMKSQNESDDFIDYVIDWMDSIKGKYEVELVKEFHPAFKDKTNDEIFNFIVDQVRRVPNNLSSEEFGYAIMNSAFFFYRPLLKEQYKKEQTSNLFIA